MISVFISVVISVVRSPVISPVIRPVINGLTIVFIYKYKFTPSFI